ncbi:hypothetical protein KO506_07035 [Polaribacter vadi]|uniref:hypothetical protein n=1 Tax=Polaribacter TaxID=52959 RepID=UPI001C08F61A|nr:MULTISPECIES: hypothetical protein [Polaribacter]MBU3011151.1 hypothetical protein [Polaribacter vadi]MDO6740965.1 hypothetical protein [Polaribacter sp. 1_MG-2023]
MELTTEQLQRVEHYLNVKQIDYIDIRLEIFDHIISDIEAKMESEKLDFETAFYAVTDKWNKHLNDTSSFYFGIMYSAPKMVIEKAKKQYKKWFYLSFFSCLTPSIIIDNSNILVSATIENILNYAFYGITFICLLIGVYLFIKKDTKKVKTTYSFVLKTQSLGFVIGFPILFSLRFLSENGVLNSFNISFLSIFILHLFCYFHFYKKHKEAIKKYKIS